MPLLRDLLAFVLGSVGVMADFFASVDLRSGQPLPGLALGLGGVLAVWAAFRIASRDSSPS